MYIYTPYFYIIQDVSKGIYYAGSKWAEDANPNTFMTEGGYTTSSATINELIRQHGLSNFIIRKIRTFETGEAAHDYETRFLQKIDAKNNPRFYNKHNNDHLIGYGTKRYEEMMISHYGVNHPSHSEEIKMKKMNTMLDRYGVDHYSKTGGYRDKFVETSLNRYGVEHPMQDNLIKERMFKTKTEKYGNPTYANSEKSKETKLKKYGDPNYNNIEKSKKTKLDKYGSSSYVNKEKAEKTNIEKYGVDNLFKLPEIIEKISNHRNMMLSRKNVEELKILSKKYKISLGRNWNRRSDQWINEKLEFIKNEYELSPLPQCLR